MEGVFGRSEPPCGGGVQLRDILLGFPVLRLDTVWPVVTIFQESRWVDQRKGGQREGEDCDVVIEVANETANVQVCLK